MGVPLEPPLRSCSGWRPHDRPAPVALDHGPLYVHSASTTARLWHRVRSGTAEPGRPSPIVYYVFCGQLVFASRSVAVYSLPSTGEVCGTCEGRAIGAGHGAHALSVNAPVRFSPRRLTPPRVCPGSGPGGVRATDRGRVAECRVCGEVVRTRAGGGPFRGWWGLQRHEPGPGLPPGCPFHAWRQLAVRLSDDVVLCWCEVQHEDHERIG